MKIAEKLKGQSILIYDIETHTFGKPDIEKDEFRIFGCYSYLFDKVWLLDKLDQVQMVINKHRFLVGFNNVGLRDRPGYDNPILERHNISFKYKRFLDLRSLFMQRASVMKIKQGQLNELLIRFSLDFILKVLGIGDGKQQIDYKIFQKSVWTPDELKKILSYTRQDILITKQLYEWVEEYFWSFRDFILPNDVTKKIYLTATTAKFTYKAICKEMKWEEKYGGDGSKEEIIGGGYVAYPAGEKFEGDIFCLDFASLYPHIMMMCNIHNRRKIHELDDDKSVWNGNNRWKTLGTYYADEMGAVGKLIMKWYNDRLIFKKAKDRREYTIKIILNTCYGVMDNSYYNLVYDKIGSSDITRIGRQWIHEARKLFREHKYKVLYTDTDSIYILDPFKNKDKVMETCKILEDDILSTVPFPQDTFKFKIDDEIKYMFFFKGGDKEKQYPKNEFFSDEDDFINRSKGLMKKNYIYVTKAGKLVIKNLGIKKKDRSPLGKKVFWEHLVPQIKEGKIKFSKSYIKNLIDELLEKDIKLAMLRRDVGTLEQYKNTSSIQAQISQKYGAGLHFLIPNTRGIGVGKGKSFCTYEEYKKHNLRIHDINTNNTWKELDYFIQQPTIRNIFAYVNTGEKEKVLE